MAYTIQRLGATDWALLRRVRLEALADSPYAFGSSFAEEAERDDGWWKASADKLAWFVATTGSGAAEAVGLIAGLADEANPRSPAVISMWVAPECRGTGVADDLLDALERWAQSDGAVALVLRVAEGNERAWRFYRRRGFVPTGYREPLRSEPATMATEMRLELRSGRC